MTKSTQLPDLESVKEWFMYDSITGKITWTKDRWYNAKGGDEAGSICTTTGYRRIRLGKSKKLQAHRLAWFLHFGKDPYPYEIDHINGNRLDNRIANLRLVDKSQNQLNRPKLNKNNSTGYRGVYAYKNKWVAKIQIGGGFTCLGTYENKEDAASAYEKANEHRLRQANLSTTGSKQLDQQG